MNKFVCEECGKFCYSAATAETMSDDRCPYSGCHGHVIPEEDERSITTDEDHDGDQENPAHPRTA